MTTVVDNCAAIVEDYLLVWVLAAVAVGVLVPRVAVLSPLTTLVLAVMIGSISLTLSPTAFRAVRPRALAPILVVQTGMPLAASDVAHALALSPTLTLGFVLLGAVTPELVTPVMTELGGGDTALATTVLVVVGVGTLVVVPGAVALLVDGPAGVVEPTPIVEGLVLAVVGPMTVAVALRARFPTSVGRYDEYYPAVSALMVVVVIGIVTAANASLVRSSGAPLLAVAAGAVLLNGVGYLAGWVGTTGLRRAERIAGVFSVGMRDFAVAGALVVGTGLPTAAALPAVVFGVVEMSSSAALARLFRG
jgi:BASS family bile acid:Na+ symporter